MNKIKQSSRSGAHLVAAGIFLSRIAGLIRQRAFAHYFGNSDAGDAFYAALKIPNFLQNLFGEGVLSASFIPVYANLLGANKSSTSENREADAVASTIGSLLFLLTSALVLVGILTTEYLIDWIAPGFTGEKRALTIRLVQIFFPATGLLVMSAWCLGILNSHRKFFLSYAAPVIWNAAIISTLLFFGPQTPHSSLAVYTAWGLVLGSALQFLVQLPTALSLVKTATFQLSLQLASVRTVLVNFVPVVIARGVVQVSAYIDTILASFLPMGAVSALAYAQALYMLPISLFGMSISNAELPAMAKAQGSAEEIAEYLRNRVNSSLAQIAFFIVPSVIAFLLLGDLIVAALYQSGKFSHQSTLYVWGVLAGSTIGLLASTLGRLYSSTFYSLKDTRTPLGFAIVRVLLTTLLGYLCGLKVPMWLGLDPAWGTAGLTASAGVSGWVEFVLLRSGIHKKIGQTKIPFKKLGSLWGSAIFSGGLCFLLKQGLPNLHPIVATLLILGLYGCLYLGFTSALGVGESKRLLDRINLKFTRSRS